MPSFAKDIQQPEFSLKEESSSVTCMYFCLVLTAKGFIIWCETKTFPVCSNNDLFDMPQTKDVIAYYILNADHRSVPPFFRIERHRKIVQDADRDFGRNAPGVLALYVLTLERWHDGNLAVYERNSSPKVC